MAFSVKTPKRKESKAFEVPSTRSERDNQAEYFRQSNNQKEYNGWTNYTTWNVALNIDNDQYMQEETLRVIKEGEVNNGDELKSWFKQNLEDAGNYNEEYHSYKLSDAWNERELDSDVNWFELFESYKQQVEDNKKYEEEKEDDEGLEI